MRREPGISVEAMPFFLFTLLAAGASVLLLASSYYYLAWAPAASVILFLLIARRPRAFFFLLVFLVPFDSFTRLNTALPFLTAPKIIGFSLVLFVALFLVLAKKDYTLPSARLPILLALFLLANVVSSLLSPYAATVADSARQLLVAYATLFLAFFFITEEGHFRTLSVVVSASLLLSSCLAIFGFLAQNPLFAVSVRSEQLFRATGGTSHPNHFAATAIFGLPLMAYWIFNSRRPAWRVLAVAGFLATATAVALSYSRAGFVVFSATVALMAFSNFRRLRARTLWVPMAMLLGLAAYLIAIPPASYIERIRTTTEHTDKSMSGRISYLKVAAETFAENPFFGTGPGTFHHVFGRSLYAREFRVPGETSHERRAHNSYVEVLTGAGIVAFALYAGIIVVSLRNFIVSRALCAAAGRRDLAALAGGYALAFTSLLMYFFFLSRVYHRYFWLSVAVSYTFLAFARRLPVPRESDAAP